MLEKIQMLMDVLDEVTISTNITEYKDVKLIDADHNSVCFIHGDNKVYIPTQSIQSLKHK